MEEYKVTVTAPEKEAEEPPSPKGPKLPLTMAKLETLNCSSGSSSPSELPQLVRSQSVQSLTSNLYALAEELSVTQLKLLQASSLTIKNHSIQTVFCGKKFRNKNSHHIDIHII